MYVSQHVLFLYLAIVITDRETGRSRGFGFVTYMDSKGFDEAIDQDGKIVSMLGPNESFVKASQLWKITPVHRPFHFLFHPLQSTLPCISLSPHFTPPLISHTVTNHLMSSSFPFFLRVLRGNKCFEGNCCYEHHRKCFQQLPKFSFRKLKLVG